MPVAEQPPEAGQVVRGADQQDLPDAGEHQRRQRVVDHRLVVDREQLLRHRPGDRVQPGAGAAGEDDALHRVRQLPASRSVAEALAPRRQRSRPPRPPCSRSSTLLSGRRAACGLSAKYAAVVVVVTSPRFAPGECEGRAGHLGPRRRLAAVGQVLGAGRCAGSQQRRRCRPRGPRRRSAGRSGRRRRRGRRRARPAPASSARSSRPRPPPSSVRTIRWRAAEGRGDVPRGLRRAVGAERAQRRVLGDRAGARAVEHVLAGDVHQRHAVRGGRGGEVRDRRRVGRPGRDPALRRLGPVDRGVGGGVDDHVDAGPVVRADDRAASVTSRSARCSASNRRRAAARSAPGRAGRPRRGRRSSRQRQLGVPGLAGLPGREQPGRRGPGRARAPRRPCRTGSVRDRRARAGPAPGPAGRCRARRRGGSRWSTGRSSPCRPPARRTRARGPRRGRPRGRTRRRARRPRPARTSASRPGRRR